LIQTQSEIGVEKERHTYGRRNIIDKHSSINLQRNSFSHYAEHTWWYTASSPTYTLYLNKYAHANLFTYHRYDTPRPNLPGRTHIHLPLRRHRPIKIPRYIPQHPLFRKPSLPSTLSIPQTNPFNKSLYPILLALIVIKAQSLR
jgi:hypothetical protein